MFSVFFISLLSPIAFNFIALFYSRITSVRRVSSHDNIVDSEGESGPDNSSVTTPSLIDRFSLACAINLTVLSPFYEIVWTVIFSIGSLRKIVFNFE